MGALTLWRFKKRATIMNSTWWLPSYIVPTEKILLDNLQIIPAGLVVVNDDWQRNH